MKVLDVLVEKLHRMNNRRYSPSKEELCVTLDTYLKPHLSNENILCPRVWANFYEFWKDIDSGDEILPIWLTSEHMMRRYPKFFLNATMMTGPTSLVAAKNGGKMAVAAYSDDLASYEIQPPPSQFASVREDIQDSKAIERIVGMRLTSLVNHVCDQLAEKWTNIINAGGMVFPYMPLMIYSKHKDYWNHKIYLRSRYGVASEDLYNR